MFGDSHEAALKTLHRYETSARSALYRSLNQLRVLQKDRAQAVAARIKAGNKLALDNLMRQLEAPLPGFEHVEATIEAREKAERDARNRAKPISQPSNAPKNPNSGIHALNSPDNDPPSGR